jgi:hypothetical protein
LCCDHETLLFMQIESDFAWASKQPLPLTRKNSQCFIML